MTTSFSDFLREQAEKYEAQARAGRAIIEEWQAAIERLFAQLTGWLKEADPTGLIEIERGTEKVREPGLGPYEAPASTFGPSASGSALSPRHARLSAPPSHRKRRCRNEPRAVSI